MNSMYAWFRNNLELIIFIYGFAFVVIGISILVSQKSNSRFKIAGILWYFAAYAFLHASSDFIKMWSDLKYRSDVLFMTGKAMELISYIFVFEFGRRIINILKPGIKILNSVTLPCIIISVFITSLMTENYMRTFDILMGYFVRFPGGLMAGLGLRYYYLSEKEILPRNVKKYFFLGGAALLFWSILCGLIRSKGDFFPANYLNIESFFMFFKVPVYLFRSVCAVIISWSFVGILGIFSWERQKMIEDILEKERESKEYFYNIINNISDSLVITDKWGTITDLNKSTTDLLNYAIEDLIGKNIGILFAGDTPALKTLYDDIRFKKCPESHEMQFLKKDGNKIPIIFSYSTFRKNDRIDNSNYVIGISKDISERKKAEEELKSAKDNLEIMVRERTTDLEKTCITLKEEIELRVKAEKGEKDAYKFQQAIIDNLADSVVVIDRDCSVKLMNRASKKLYHETEISKFSCSRMFCSNTNNEKTGGLEKIKETITYEYEMHNLDGKKINAEMIISPLVMEDGSFQGIIETIRDITDRRRLEKEIITAIESERQRIGQDLHDDLAQNLIAIDLLCKMLNEKLAKKRGAETETRELGKIITFVNNSITTTRRLAKGLCPIHMENGGFSEAVKKMVSNIQEALHMKIHLMIDENVPVHDNITAINLYQIIQEAINNIIKHSMAHNIFIEITWEEENLAMTIYDDGVGIPEDFENKAGMGIRIMNYRANMIGSKLNIGKKNDKGTEIKCLLPLNVTGKNRESGEYHVE